MRGTSQQGSKNSESLLAEVQQGHQEAGRASANWKWWLGGMQLEESWGREGPCATETQLRSSGHEFHSLVFNMCIMKTAKWVKGLVRPSNAIMKCHHEMSCHHQNKIIFIIVNVIMKAKA